VFLCFLDRRVKTADAYPVFRAGCVYWGWKVLQANVLFRLGAILLFLFLFLQSLLGLPLLGLPPRDDEMVVFAVATTA
jgi:hypothetical protein